MATRQIRVLAPASAVRVVGAARVGSFAHAVFELVINAVESGASKIAVALEPRSLTASVIDNGGGLSCADDMDLVFVRFATSKKSSEVRPRGGALAALASTAGLAEFASREFVAFHDLFACLPVRAQAGRARPQLGEIADFVRRLAIARPDVAFSVWDKGAKQYLLPPRPLHTSPTTFYLGRATADMLLPLPGGGKADVIGHPRTFGASPSVMHVCINSVPLARSSPIHKLLLGIARGVWADAQLVASCGLPVAAGDLAGARGHPGLIFSPNGAAKASARVRARYLACVVDIAMPAASLELRLRRGGGVVAGDALDDELASLADRIHVVYSSLFVGRAALDALAEVVASALAAAVSRPLSRASLVGRVERGANSPPSVRETAAAASLASSPYTLRRIRPEAPSASQASRDLARLLATAGATLESDDDENYAAPPPKLTVPLFGSLTTTRRATLDKLAESRSSASARVRRRDSNGESGNARPRKVPRLLRHGGRSLAASSARVATPGAADRVRTLFECWQPRQFGSAVEGSQTSARALVPVKLTKAALKSGLVAVGQANAEFILARLVSNGWLVVVDQHAAHERTRLEALEADVVLDAGIVPRVARIIHLARPMVFAASPAEALVVNEARDALHEWGIDARVLETVVEVATLPSIIGAGALSATVWAGVVSYANAVLEARSSRLVPRLITHALHSAACHSAVRFGDELDVGQQQAILDDLIECELPFQCAHGRPTMVPLWTAARPSGDR
ncbi:uncharacterized protein AMSG_06120 [Thecamonas trahens ATCC 50062]|uniref:MutL C-terminal dimerisation domain-containing protein n=1 Tax=Thecamonas trahens ATCC 50062 TaxID=461836 RepID=A0A0L0DBW5_THETB|nr:hypothetical protein AMSG_06120 [Thecamonas trahens ATCC 50062]KNC49837.1 hypothetical protein AMSG_06120 [Thecamonas trahens ATCC 50062]|eukprot:XP_013757329.1 hypothetical protein AMSG_06120 [Thecamonas trahens ATCC 50062]